MNAAVTVQIPGSKSLAHRALICAALASGESVLENVPESDDVLHTIAALRVCGVSIQRAGSSAYRVIGLGGPPRNLSDSPLECFAGESGTTLRLLTAILAAGQGLFRLGGTPGLFLRPLADIIEPLCLLGADIIDAAGSGTDTSPGLMINSRGLGAGAHTVRALPTAARPVAVLTPDGAVGEIDEVAGEVFVSCDKTSQALSSLLLAAPYAYSSAGAQGGLTIHLAGQNPVSWPYVGLTLQIMERFGVRPRLELLEPSSPKQSGAKPQEADFCGGSASYSFGPADHGLPQEADFCGGSASLAAEMQSATSGVWHEVQWSDIVGCPATLPGKLRFIVPFGGYQAVDVALESDWSSASYFLAAGALGPRPVRVLGLNQASQQGDRAILRILSDMGARITLEADAVVVGPGERTGAGNRGEAGNYDNSSHLRGIDYDMSGCPDLVPTVLALAAHATGDSRVYNVGHLRFKESDRAQALLQELTKVGCSVRLFETDLLLSSPPGGPVEAARHTMFNTFGDHRLAMAFSLLGLDPFGKSTMVRLDNYKCVKKSFPTFWKEWDKLFTR